MTFSSNNSLGKLTLNHSSFFMSSMVNRFATSTWNIPAKSSLHFSDNATFDGKPYSPFNILFTVFLKFFGSFLSSNGYLPHNMTYNVTPHDHTSAALPSYWPCRLSTSGAMYAGVPTADFGAESIKECLEYPKSQIFNRGAFAPPPPPFCCSPPLSINAFSSFKSLCATPFAWQ